MKQTPVPPFNVGTKWLKLELGHNIEWGSGGSGILWRVKPILTVLAILFHLFCRGLSEHMYKYCQSQTRTYRHAEETRTFCVQAETVLVGRGMLGRVGR